MKISIAKNFSRPHNYPRLERPFVSSKSMIDTDEFPARERINRKLILTRNNALIKPPWV